MSRVSSDVHGTHDSDGPGSAVDLADSDLAEADPAGQDQALPGDSAGYGQGAEPGAESDTGPDADLDTGTDAGSDPALPRRRSRPGWERGRVWMRPTAGPYPPTRASIRERLAPSFYPEFFRGAGWILPLLVTIIGGVTRFWNLGSPKQIIFDETYYAKDGWSMYVYGWEHNWQPAATADPAVAKGNALFGTGPEFVVHPPFGKWVIGAGEHVWGLDPVGWRIMEALLGTIAIYIMARTARRMFRSTLLGCIAGLFLAFDGLAFVMARTALLDGLLMFWVLAGFSCLVVDRDKTREKFAAWREERGCELLSAIDRGPRLGVRPWRLLAGLCLGLGAATKWNGMFFCAAFAILSVLWDLGARRAVGVRWPAYATFVRDVFWAFLSLPVLMLATFVSSYAGWFFQTSDGGGYDRFWANANHSNFWPTWTDPFRSLWNYVYQQYQFNANLQTPHPYMSNPWSWLVMGRPVAFYYCGDPKPGVALCPTGSSNGYSQEVLALGNPLLWWIATAGILFLFWRWIARRDWRAGAILCGIAAGIVPWMHYAERTIFSFYAVAFVPFMALSATMVVGAVLGRADASPIRRSWGAATAGTIVVAVVALFMYFYPIYTGQTISYSDWSNHMWFTSWI
jgi:dolichyl-phosphate-mannose-protein mannosyltransferase